MGKKIFVSYKYSDNLVLNLEDGIDSKVRDYVDVFEQKMDGEDDIYKGESDGDDLSELNEDTIWEKLKDRIYDSSVTIVFISPGMRNNNIEDKEQWIPWEVSYSLKETFRRNKKGDSVTSHSNAMIAVVLPDINGSYAYYLEEKNCCEGGCTMHHTNKLFTIIKKNKFNRIQNSKKHTCDNKDTIWSGTCSYIEAVKWSEFIDNYKYYVDRAVERQDNIEEYDIRKEV